MWLGHIKEWSKLHNKNYKKVEKILLRGGWRPSKYTVEMRGPLFDYLNKWYKLSVKKLPKPFTSFRRNISIDVVDDYFGSDELVTTFSDGWVVRSSLVDSQFISIAFNEILSRETPPEEADTLVDAVVNHNDLVDDILNGRLL